MREGQVPDVMTECRHPQHGPPVLALAAARRHYFAYRVGEVLVAHDHVVDATRQLHHAERMLKAAVRSAGVDQVGQRQLMDVAKTLKRRGVDDGELVRVRLHEDVNRVADLVELLHCEATVGGPPANSRAANTHAAMARRWSSQGNHRTYV